MADYIDRDALLKKIRWASSPEECVMSAKRMPAVDVAPVVRGQWATTDAYPHRLYCPVCFKTALPNVEYLEQWGLDFNYCPSCGAMLDGGADDGMGHKM